MPETIDLANLTVDDFSPIVNTKFDLHLSDDTIIPLTLTSAKKMGIESLGQRHAFSLLFDGPPDQILPQQIYLLNHEAVGSLGIFLVPIALTADASQYEAVFT